MKLYTEEQVIKAYNMGIDDGHNGAISLQINELSLTPIELPSDEDIEKKSYKLFHQNDNIGKGTWIYGAKWMKEQILNQDN